jgi:hypothetical protein
MTNKELYQLALDQLEARVTDKIVMQTVSVLTSLNLPMEKGILITSYNITSYNDAPITVYQNDCEVIH